MKRIIVAGLIAALALQAAPAMAARGKVVRRPAPARTKIVVHKRFPIHRSHPAVVVKRRPVVIEPRIVYGAPVLWAGVLVTLPPRQRLVWEDGETLYKEEGWAEVALDVNDRGEELYLELIGRAQLDWAEVVFGNGEARVVDFRQRTHKPGLYSLLDFRDGRMVRYVRLVARAQSREARVVVRMAK